MATGAVSVDELVSAMDVPEKLESKLIKNSKRYSVGNKSGDGVTPNSRPVRERKAVDRYSMSSPDSPSSGSKTLSISKGSGTPLKDIPNVAFKLSKRKADDTLQLLHMIIFGKRAKARNLKKDIGLFSGFVWEANEEKQRAKMKEKLDKCVKDKLVDFCDVLNIPVKSTVKKEYILNKLLEFLESPHATTEVLLADKEQKSKKQKRSATTSGSRSSKKAAGENSAKKTQSGEKRKRSAIFKENETNDIDDKMSGQSHSSGEEDDVLQKQDSDQERISSDEEKDELKDKKTSPESSSNDNSKEKSGTKSPATSAKKTKDTPSNSKSAKKIKDTPKNFRSAKKITDTSEKSSSVIEPSASSLKEKGSASKTRQKVDEETKNTKSISEEKSPSKKLTSKSAKSVRGEEETNEEDKAEPTKEELHAVAVNILKEVDFNTATLSDILRLLGSRFGLDLMHRKSEVKAIIQEVIESMSDGDSDDNNEKDGDEDENSGKE